MTDLADQIIALVEGSSRLQTDHAALREKVNDILCNASNRDAVFHAFHLIEAFAEFDNWGEGMVGPKLHDEMMSRLQKDLPALERLKASFTNPKRKSGYVVPFGKDVVVTCSQCGAQEWTEHAKDCPAYLEARDALRKRVEDDIIKQLSAHNSRYHSVEIVNCLGNDHDQPDILEALERLEDSGRILRSIQDGRYRIPVGVVDQPDAPEKGGTQPPEAEIEVEEAESSTVVPKTDHRGCPECESPYLSVTAAQIHCPHCGLVISKRGES